MRVVNVKTDRRPLAAAAAVLCFVMGCGGITGSDSPLELSLQVPATVSLGEEVSLVLRVTNSGTRPQRVSPNGEPVGFQVVIRGLDGTVVWNSMPPDATLADTERHYELAAGESIAFETLWSPRTFLGTTVPPGRFTATGFFRESGRPERIVEAQFTVRAQ